MKQTSLLDSFIKKANKTQDQSRIQQLESKVSSQGNSSIKQNRKNVNKQSDIGENTPRKVIDKTPQKAHKMQVEVTQPKVDIQSEQYNFKSLKKQVTSTQKGRSQNRNKRGKVSKRKKNSDDEYSMQDQQQNEQPFSEEEKQSQVQQDESQGEGFVNRPKGNTATKKRGIKAQKKFKASFDPKQTANKVAQPPNQQQACQDTILFDRSKFSDPTPEWAVPGNPKCKDKEGVSCKSLDYDETTLFVPQQIWKQASGPMKQYWKIKSQNFDKIIFFKLGKFYQLFYQDALLGNQLLDLKWMATKMHVGFPQKSLQRYTRQLVKHGLKVVVVEQMQTSQEMSERLKEDKVKGRKSQKTLHRQVTQIITKGTLQAQEEQTYLPNYLMSVYRYDHFIAYSLLEVGTNLILMGIVDGFQQFKTILYQTRPSELLYDPDNLPKQHLEIMKQNIQAMIFSKLINKQNLWHHLNAANELRQLQQKNVITKPKILSTIQKFDAIPRNLMISTLSGLFEYLHRIFKFEYVLATAKFKFYQKQKALTHMVLDSQALQHLQIFQTGAGEAGSLFEKIQRTKSKFGKRLFRRWMTSPLLSEYQINQRLDAVCDLRQLGNQLDKIQSVMSKLPDLQKLSNKLYKYSVTNTSAASAVYFQDLHTSRLKQFDNFMRSTEDSLVIFKYIQSHSGQLTSHRLRQLITPNKNQQVLEQEKLIYFQDQEFKAEEGQAQAQAKGLLPDIISHLHSFKQYIVWKEGKPIPKQGVVTMYDQLMKGERLIKKKLDLQLEQIRMQFKCADICYAHIKERYEVEIPEKRNLKLPSQFSFSSRKAGYSRYLVPQVQQIVSELQAIQKGVKSQMGIFVSFFFEQFRSKQNIWQRYINILAQIDCYCGMAQYSRQRKTCRPQFIQQGYEVVQSVHPALYSIDFVPNDISFKDPIIILTGPNMGGKSTILRTACLLSVMAQMGCYVPCKSYRASIIDRIFTRIGASDKLQAGKSTFFIQMEQTKSIVNYATSRSLAIVDELGRGTATYDGMALAHSVLNYLINRISCKCLFATHYHSLTQQFASMPGTCLKMMDYQLRASEQDRIDFLYKLVSGKAEKSFGLNVALMVGLPKELIQAARVKSDEMHEQIQRKKKMIKVFQVLDQISHIKSQ